MPKTGKCGPETPNAVVTQTSWLFSFKLSNIDLSCCWVSPHNAQNCSVYWSLVPFCPISIRNIYILLSMFGQRPLKMESSRQPSAPTTWSNLLPHQFQKCKDLCWWQQVTTNSYIWFLKLCLLIDRYLLLTWWIFFLFWFSTQIEKHCTMIYVIVSLQAVIYISILFSCIVYNVLSTE